MAHGKVRWATALIAVLVLVTTASPWSLAQIPPADQSHDSIVVRLDRGSHDQLASLLTTHDRHAASHGLSTGDHQVGPPVGGDKGERTRCLERRKCIE
jgi:hypothetical protein